ncbi:MAG: SDR family NAD(P)-dependent oxidoreductase [Thermoactinospora sp.]|nr:SDR family NAD(P)-dependent oxidoreductase [Thermoactinospora sp.]
MSGVVIIGAGPGIGQAVARRFAREGLPVALVARSQETLRSAVPGALTATADAGDEKALTAALDTIAAEHGVPDAVVYNAAVIRPDRPADLSLDDHLGRWAVNVGGAIVTAARLLPAMAGRGRGSFLVTGGMPEPKAAYLSLSLGKAGIRTLVTALHEEYGPAGVHAASITVGGVVAPGTAFDPDGIAEHYWRLHLQPRAAWEHEVRIGC